MDEQVLSICRAVKEEGGRAFLVGGWVRDHLIGIESKDYDIEVYGVSVPALHKLLEEIGPVKTVGESFTVLKLCTRKAIRDEETLKDRLPATNDISEELTEEDELTWEYSEIDVSIPRRESKSGRGHRGFRVEGDPSMPVEEATRRRDFTVNAILYDPLTDDLIDPFGGVNDLKERILKVVDPKSFIEDSLRVLRAVQLAGRYNLNIDPGTIDVCRSIELSDLPHERIWGEFEKLLLMSCKPSRGLEAALTLGVLDKLFPRIKALVNCGLFPEFSDQTDAFTHTGRSLDQAVVLTNNLPREKRLTVLLAAICHELSMPECLPPDTISSEVNLANLLKTSTFSVLDRLGINTLNGFDVRRQVISLVNSRQMPRRMFADRERVSAGDFRRLSMLVNLEMLCCLSKACALASGFSSEAEEWFILSARDLGVDHGPPSPILLGRHLLADGLKPGPLIGDILHRVYELQLDGEVQTHEDAVTAARRFVSMLNTDIKDEHK